jgi:phosphonopyruvate decarboxylase
MLSPQKFTEELIKNDLGPVVEVPCSYLTHWLNYLWDSGSFKVINPANEAVVMGIAAGEYLGSGKIPVVAVQNSGFMNTLNALTSLNQIYDIPAFMMVTWRGEGGVGVDAPEHDITGENLLKYMDTFGLSYEILTEADYIQQIKRLVNKAKETKKPVVLIIKKNTFEPYEVKNKREDKFEMNRFDAIKIIKEKVVNNAVLVSGTAFPTRDSFAVKDSPDFYIMGSMGHAFSIALGIAPNTKKKVVVLDGDGGALMQAGGFASLGRDDSKNIIYVCLDNGSYESTGGQPASSVNVDFIQLAKGFGFKNVASVTTKKDLELATDKFSKEDGPTFLHVKVKLGEHSKSKRVSDVYTCPQITSRFMKQFGK